MNRIRLLPRRADDEPMTSRGELRIFLGAAPGAGKTYAMLSEAQRRASRGTDVVVGVVNTHGREKAVELLAGLPRVSHAAVSHAAGGQGQELDVSKVLHRAPQVVLVDDLAHTNAAGSRNPKRWQDIEELLNAGITVLSTVNVQHLASLQDVVEQIVGVREPETVPDEVLRGADQVELVDVTPEALRRRLAHGHVYAAAQMDAARAKLFELGTLSALRQLALSWVADQMGDAVLRHRQLQHITGPWETRERIVVAVSGGTGSEAVLRRAARIATRSKGELLCVHVLSSHRGARPAAAPSPALRQLASDVGASFHTVVGDNVPASLLEFADAVNATQLVAGISRRSLWSRTLRHGVADRLLRDSGPIDVQLVNHPGSDRRWQVSGRRSAVPHRRRAIGWALALLLPLTVTVTAAALRDVVPFPTAVVLLFLSTVLTALVGGLGPALLAAFAGGLLLNFFLTPPIYTFAVAAAENLVTLASMVAVAVLVALVVDRAARRAQQAAAAGAESALLATFSRTVLTHPDPLAPLLQKVSEAFGFSSVAVLERHEHAWSVIAAVGGPGSALPEQPSVDIAMEPDTHLIAEGKVLSAADRRLLETVAGQILLTLRTQRISAEAAEYHRRAAANELRTALLSAIGHDLRSPLTSIKAAAASLNDPGLPLTGSDRAELAGAIEQSADRLTALVANLLDSSRLATGAVNPAIRPVSFEEVTARALATVDGADRVAVDIDDRAPEILADPGLLDRVIANVVDNALLHGKGAPIVLRTSEHAGRVELRVIDSGPGVLAGRANNLFTPFQRHGDHDNTSGLGLGLSVAQGFTNAMSGQLTAEDTPGGGLTIVISLPPAPVVTTA
jgi:two-component system, OmpR family, sensor histidine kinase KdpD